MHERITALAVEPVKNHPHEDAFFYQKTSSGWLVLSDGATFEGHISESFRSASGEVVFTTGMTGYVETLTDPSYAGQIVVFTYPLIGNYGVPSRETWESQRIHARGVIMSEACAQWSHAEGRMSLEEWLREQDVPFMTAVDTRALTRHVRHNGATAGWMIAGEKPNVIPPFYQTDTIVSQVSITEPITVRTGQKKIILVDCGMKENIVREFAQHDLTIVRVPFDYDYTTDTFDGVFLSNGPGDPQVLQETIRILAIALTRERPVFGICLGSQLMACAAGATTYKLKYGHRGHNQPCINTETNRAVITSQNHGYAIDEASLPPEWRVSYRNLNDETVEGIAHRSKPFFSVQFHPEASPGPTDSRHLFDDFLATL